MHLKSHIFLFCWLMLKQMKPDFSSSHAKKRHKDQTSVKLKEKRAENVRRIACRKNRFKSMWFQNLWQNENNAILRRETRPTSRSDNMREMNDSLMTAGLRREAKFALKCFWIEVNICTVKDQLRACGGSTLNTSLEVLEVRPRLFCYSFTANFWSFYFEIDIVPRRES